MRKFIAMPLLVILADQFSKIVAQRMLVNGPRAILPFFDFTLVHNTGISFGLFNQTAYGPLLLTLASLAIVIFFADWLRRATQPALIVAIGAVIGGALGNVIDRVRLGWVIDFLDFHVNTGGRDWHYPAFNIADSCIVLGIAYIVLDGLWFEPKRQLKSTSHEKN